MNIHTGVVLEAAFLFGGNPRIKKRQDNRFVDWGRHDEFDSRRSANRKIKEIGFGEAVEIV